MENILAPARARDNRADPAATAAPDAALLAQAMAHVDQLAEQALAGFGLDPRLQEALRKSPLSGPAEALRSKLTLALAEKACEIAERDPEGASHALAMASAALGPKASRLAERPSAELSSSYPTLASLLSGARMGRAPLQLATTASKAKHDRQEREERASEDSVIAKPVSASLFDDMFEGMEDAVGISPKPRM